MDVRDLARQLSQVTWEEAKLCYRTPQEIEAAFRQDRCFASRDDGDVAGVLFLWPYDDDWVELGTAYVFPDHRGQGHLTRVHQAAVDHLDEADKNAFEFPGNGAVQHVLEKTGFERTRIREIPWSVWMTFLNRRRTRDKLRSYWTMAQSPDPLHSLKLYTYRTVEPAEPPPRRLKLLEASFLP